MKQKIEVSDDQVVPLDNIAPGLIGLRILFVNVFAIVGDNGWTLIDAGLNGATGRILGWARRHFGNQPPSSIVLTHGHFDHVGALDGLLEHWSVPVYAHREEMPYVTGEREYPAPDPSVGGGLMARMSVMYPRGPIDVSDRLRVLPSDGSLDGHPDWRCMHTPGHTPGHISLFRAADRTLIVGDAFCTIQAESLLAVATGKPEMHGPPAYFTTDWDAARHSVEHLAALDPACIAPGHGEPMAGDEAGRALLELADRFDEVARPEHGRYVARPHSGVRS